MDDILDSITMYPNPFNTIIEVESDYDILLWRLISLDGRIVISKTNQAYINTDNILAGSYLLQVITEEGFIAKKVLKL